MIMQQLQAKKYFIHLSMVRTIPWKNGFSPVTLQDLLIVAINPF